MTAKRKRILRMPHVQLTPEVVAAFEKIKKLERQCSCGGELDECPACKAWWTQQTVIHRALKLRPVFWPCLPEPGPISVASPVALALYAELEKALGEFRRAEMPPASGPGSAVAHPVPARQLPRRRQGTRRRTPAFAASTGRHARAHDSGEWPGPSHGLPNAAGGPTG